MNTRVPVNTNNPSLPSMPGTDAGGIPGPHAFMHKHEGDDEVATATPAPNQIVKAEEDGKINDGWLSSLIARIADLTWGNIVGKPNEFPPEAHTHAKSDVTDLETDLLRLPSGSQKDALDGTSGTPGSGNKFVTDSDTRLINSRPPTGGAGGVLSGNYPNPGFAVDMATQGELDGHTSDKANPHAVTKAQVGLDQVNNTSDADKPVSTAQQLALDDKADDNDPRIANAISVGGNTIAMLGTSISAQNYSVANNAFSATGNLVWANALMGGRFKIIGVGGYSGQSAAYLLSKVPDVLALKSRWVWVDAGTNDMGEAITPSSVVATITQIWDGLILGGARVIAQTIPPRSDGAIGMQENIQKTNVLLRIEAAKRGIILIDNHAVLSDPATGHWRSGMADGAGIHPNAIGAYYWGKEAARVLTPIVPEWSDLPSDNLSVVGGNLMPNGMMMGDSGGLATGVTRFPIESTPTKISRTDNFGGEWQRISASATLNTYVRATSSTQIVNGDWICGVAEVRVGESTNFKNISVILTAVGGANPSATGLRSQSTYPSTPENLEDKTMIIRTPPVQMTESTSQIRMDIRVDLSASGDVVFDVGRYAVYKTTGAFPFFTP